MSLLKDKKSSRTEAEAARAAPASVVIGQFVGLAADGAPLVDFAANPAGGPVAALATAGYGGIVPGTPVALMFLDGDAARPIAIGLIDAAETETPAAPAQAETTPDETVTFAAPRELVLQCGRASIVLTRAGKVLIRGTYVSTRSSGMNRITGASVQIN